MKTLAKLLAIGLLVGANGTVAIHTASADDEGVSQHPPQMGEHHSFMQNVTHSVEKIDNGVVITLTSDDPDTVQKLQEFETQEGKPKHHHLKLLENVTRSVVTLENGVQITLTSDDADTVEKLQKGPLGGRFQEKLPDVTRSVEKIENGVVITLTSDNPDTVTKLQERADQEQE